MDQQNNRNLYTVRGLTLFFVGYCCAFLFFVFNNLYKNNDWTMHDVLCMYTNNRLDSALTKKSIIENADLQRTVSIAPSSRKSAYYTQYGLCVSDSESDGTSGLFANYIWGFVAYNRDITSALVAKGVDPNLAKNITRYLSKFGRIQNKAFHIAYEGNGVGRLVFYPNSQTEIIVDLDVMNDAQYYVSKRKAMTIMHKIRCTDINRDLRSSNVHRSMIQDIKNAIKKVCKDDIKKCTVVFSSHDTVINRIQSWVCVSFEHKGKEYRLYKFNFGKKQSYLFDKDGNSIDRVEYVTDRVPLLGKSRVSSVYGELRRRKNGTYRRHYAIDYAAAAGTPIIALDRAKVFSVRNDRKGYGLYVVLDHGNQYKTLYGHLSRTQRRLKVGQHIAKGEVIGYVGTTGNARGAHLHLELRYKNKKMDPSRGIRNINVKTKPYSLRGNSFAEFLKQKTRVDKMFM